MEYHVYIYILVRSELASGELDPQAHENCDAYDFFPTSIRSKKYNLHVMHVD